VLTKQRLPLLIASVFCLEAAIYLWAVWTTDAEYVFDKCARNSGRASSAIILITLLMMGYYGLKRIYLERKTKDAFLILVTLFSINHLIHFFYVFQNFRHHALVLDVGENLHGFITFIFIPVVPLILWSFKNLSRLLYAGITLHLFNASYFIMQTFFSKITPEKPAYHNQLGIVLISAALLYVIYRMFRENKLATNP
jgi:hypothetical protein